MKTEKGQSLVELAISITLLMYLLSGAVEFGVAFFQYVQLRDAAQEGALFASGTYPRTTQDIEKRTRSASSSPVDLYSPDVSVQINVSSGADASIACEGDAVQVRVIYPHRVTMPFMSLFIGEYINLSADVIDTVLVPVC